MWNVIIYGEPFQPVDVNLASKEQLMALPGVGGTLAEHIWMYRLEKGRFSQLTDLLKVPGFREKLLTELRGKIVFGNGGPKAVVKTEKPWSSEEIQRMLHAFGHEPSVRSVQEQAVLYAHAHPSQVNSWLERVRKAAWAPKLSTSGGRQSDLGQSVREKIGDTDIQYRRNSADWNLKVQAEWNLRDLIFNRNELYIARESDKLTRLREHVVTHITKKYFERRKLQLEDQLSTNSDNQAKLSRQLAIEELSAEIDGFTGGWFTKQIQESEHVS